MSSPVRKPFMIRIEPDLRAAVQRYAATSELTESSAARLLLMSALIDEYSPGSGPRQPSETRPPIRPEREAAEYVAVLTYLAQQVTAEVEALSRTHPLGAIDEAYELATHLMLWADTQAKALGSTVPELRSEPTGR